MTDFSRIWGSTGDVAEPTAGKVEDGWVAGGDPPRADWENWQKNQTSKGLNQIQKGGHLDYEATVTYSKDATVRYSGVNYFSLVNSNTGNQPDTSASEWETWSERVARLTPQTIWEGTGSGYDWQVVGTVLTWRGQHVPSGGGDPYLIPFAAASSTLAVPRFASATDMICTATERTGGGDTAPSTIAIRDFTLYELQYRISGAANTILWSVTGKVDPAWLALANP